MTADPEQDPIGSQWRSKKYIRMSDEEILELALRQLPEKDRYYLEQELEYRGLRGAARRVKTETTKKQMRSKAWWKYVPILFALTFVLKRMFESFNP